MKKIFASLLIASMFATSFAADAGGPPPGQKITGKQWLAGEYIICAAVVCAVHMRMTQNSKDPQQIIMSHIDDTLWFNNTTKAIIAATDF